MNISLGEICSYRSEKANVSSIGSEDLYISTESMAPNKGGISTASSIPGTGRVSFFRQGDTLVSNIRPYFKKIWHADKNGYCSNDILVFQPNDASTSDYLYWLLSGDEFFDYVMDTSKGTKMPRGDKSAIMNYAVPSNDETVRRVIVSVMSPIQSKIEANTKLNDYLAQLCEAIAEKYCEAGEVRLGDICHQVTDKANCEDAKLETYVSTESLLQNKQGRQQASSLPTTGKVTLYAAGDTLVSNIRPYFKKVWYAPFDGTCSGDVLVFRANEAEDAPYLHACLRQDRFFDHVMRGAKGTKMPRGDKKQMMEFCVSSTCGADDLSLMKAALNQIAANDAESANLEDLRDTLLPKLMSGEIDVSKVDLTQLNSHLA